MTAEQRSQQWYGGNDRDAYIHRAWMRRGLPDRAFDGRPHIAIANTASDLVPCNMHLGEVAQAVKNGIWEAGGVPLEMPVMSLGETQVRPTAMLWRNLAAMSIEEMLRANPIDGVVLLGGCDKTIPALLMAAASVNLPALLVPGGPMLTGTYCGKAIGCGTETWRMDAEVRAGKLDAEVFQASDKAMIRSKGHCNTMGTASTMALIAEGLGASMPGIAGIPAPDARLLEMAQDSGRLIIDMVAAGRRPSKIFTREAFQNAIVTLATIGGSTNGVVHLLAIAGRLGIDLTLDDFDEIGSGVPLLVNLEPAGKYLMDDLFRAGGLLAALREVRDLLSPKPITVTGHPLVNYLGGNSSRTAGLATSDRGYPSEAAPAAQIWDSDVIRPRSQPLQESAGIAVLRGNLAPDGAIIKPAAASSDLLQHRGPTVVFDSIEDFHDRIDDPNLPVTADSVLILRGCGPRGYPGMPEVGNMRVPAKLLAAGVRDMVRISDARMSGTAFGTVVLHAAPEAAAGGPLSKVRDGDIVVLDVPQRKLMLEVPDAELQAREPAAPALAAYARPRRGWEDLYVRTVLQADTGADLDFLRGSSGAAVARESH